MIAGDAGDHVSGNEAEADQPRPPKRRRCNAERCVILLVASPAGLWQDVVQSIPALVATAERLPDLPAGCVVLGAAVVGWRFVAANDASEGHAARAPFLSACCRDGRGVHGFLVYEALQMVELYDHALVGEQSQLTCVQLRRIMSMRVAGLGGGAAAETLRQRVAAWQAEYGMAKHVPACVELAPASAFGVIGYEVNVVHATPVRSHVLDIGGLPVFPTRAEVATLVLVFGILVQP